ncbi:lysophosphatidic acid receptor 6-like isoform X1 [Lampetra planeri]
MITKWLIITWTFIAAKYSNSMRISTAGARAGMTMGTPTNARNASHCGVDHDDSSHVYAAVLIIIAVLGLSGNSVALFAFIFRLKKRNAARCYCINLALADLLYMLTLPLRVATHLQGGRWPFGEVACALVFYVFFMSLYSSIFFLTAISVNRYLAVVRPIQQWQDGSRRAKMLCSGIWAFTAICASPYLLKGTDTIGKDAVCLDPQVDSTLRFVMSNVSFVLGLIFPLVIIVFCYMSILRRFNLGPTDGGSNARGRRGREKIKALAVIIIVLFMTCFVPYHVVRTVYLYLRMRANGQSDAGWYCQQANQMKPLMGALICFAAGHGCFDPVVYFFYSRHFRSFLGRMLPRRRGAVARDPRAAAVRGDATFTNSRAAASRDNADSTAVQDLKPRGSPSGEDAALPPRGKRDQLQITDNSPSNSFQSFTDS